MVTATASRGEALRWLAISVIAALSLLAIERGLGGAEQFGVSPLRQTAVHMVGMARDYSEALARSDLHVADAQQRAATLDDGWLVHEIAARASLWRARLSGSYDDHQAAKAALDKGFARAAPRTGPHMSGALLAFSMHRLDEAERYLDMIDDYAVPPGGEEAAEIKAMRGDIAFYRGDYAAALAAYDEADRLAPGTADFRRAVYHSKTGRPDLAEDYYDKAERGLPFPTPQARARMELQRGILDLESGRWDEALAHFRKADGIFPGFWLIEEHIAEVTALKGDLAGAERHYRDIVRRTGHPEFMDALAGIAAKRGDKAGEAEWTRRAAEGWRKRLRQFPEATYGHAIDHCVQKGDWGCALALAWRNHQARPYGDAKIALARALLHNGRPAEARETIDTVLASRWRTAPLHAAAAEIYAALGEAEKAAGQRRIALAMDPHALD
jgi:tetratricopeptide (TPR) repeat protein